LTIIKCAGEYCGKDSIGFFHSIFLEAISYTWKPRYVHLLFAKHTQSTRRIVAFFARWDPE
jgi:hypothetical protein